MQEIMDLFNELPYFLANQLELNRCGQAVDAGLLNAARRLLLQTRDSHHEKFIQVGTDNRKELYPLQQRIFRILCLFQDPSLELQ